MGGLNNILVVDDEPYVCDLLYRWLSAEGYNVATASNGESAIDLLEREKFHLVISDIMMPSMSGIDLLTIIRTRFRNVAVLMVTAVDDRKTGIMTLELGAYGYIIKPFEKNEILLNVAGALERLEATRLNEEYQKNLNEHIRQKVAEVLRREQEFVLRLMTAVGLPTDETSAHIKRVGLCSSALMKAYLGWDAQTVEDIKLAGAIHDIGKIQIPTSILLKPGKLTPEEFEIVKMHTVIGGSLLGDSSFEVIDLAREVALYHHEWWDGSGYPSGLAGHAIPEHARVTAVIDSYDSLTHNRVYRPAFNHDEALEIMKKQSGTHFDPQVLDCFFGILEEVKLISKEFPEEEE